jgi:hypothetical protein
MSLSFDPWFAQSYLPDNERHTMLKRAFDLKLYQKLLDMNAKESSKEARTLLTLSDDCNMLNLDRASFKTLSFSTLPGNSQDSESIKTNTSRSNSPDTEARC